MFGRLCERRSTRPSRPMCLCKYTVRAVAVSGEGGKGRRCQEDARAIMCASAPDTTRIVAICIKGKPLGVSLAISLEHACEMGLNMEWPERNIRLKGLFTSPEASRDRLTAVRAVSAIGAQLAVYTGRRETHHTGRVLIMMAELDDSWLNEDCHGGAAAP